MTEAQSVLIITLAWCGQTNKAVRIAKVSALKDDGQPEEEVRNCIGSGRFDKIHAKPSRTLVELLCIKDPSV